MNTLYVKQNFDEKVNCDLQNCRVFGDFAIALAEVRRIRMAGENSPVTLKLVGDYYTDEPIVLGAELGDNITIEGEGARLIGGVRLESIKRDNFRGVDCYSAELPRREGEYPAVSDLYVDGERYSPARYPREGFLRALSVENECPEGKDIMEAHAVSSSYFSPFVSDIVGIDDIEGATLSFYHYWIDEHTPISRYDKETNRIYMKYKSCFLITTRYEPK